MAYESREQNRAARIGRIRSAGGRRTRKSTRRSQAPSARRWDLDTFVKANAGTLTAIGLTLGVFISRRFFVLPLAVAAMVAQDTLLDRIKSRLGRLRI